MDAAFSRYDVSILEGYGRFLAAQSRVFGPIESALEAAGIEALVEDWPLRRRAARLTADLEDLGVSIGFPAVSAPALSGPAAVLGALYVLEGSRMGGALLRRALPPGAPARFLADDDRAARWRVLMDLLDQRLADPQELDVAVTSARAVFHAFLAAADFRTAA